MDNSIEVTVLVELFSTFFEKITLQHPEKEILMKDLSKFKSSIYQNQNNLQRVGDFI